MRFSKSTACALALAAAAAFVATAPAGCGTSLASIYIPADRFPASYAEALCNSLQHCCDENAVTFNYNACTAGWKGLIQQRFDDPNASALANYDPRAATNCVAQVRDAKTVSCASEPGSISAARDTCQTIFTGKKLPGQPCASSGECAPQDGAIVSCSPLPAGSDGGLLPLALPLGEPVCVAVPIPDQGAPCTLNPPHGCAGGQNLFCDPGSFTCLPQQDVGGPCLPTVPASCLPTGFCVTSGPSASLCAAVLPPGSACTDSTQCDTASVCDLAATKTCISRGAPGTACQAGTDCATGACDAIAKKCLKNTIATTNACTGVGP
jgi:hypothetical protein